METNPQIIQKLAEQKSDENWQFRSFLKNLDMSPKELDTIVQQIYENVEPQIDCKQCANCCAESIPLLNHSDISKCAAGLNIPIAKFKEQYLMAAEHQGEYTFKQRPCPFLNNNLCTIYDFRPSDCMSFPHLHKKDFVFRLIGVVENTTICPIAYHVYEQLKSELWNKY
ncbi:YkgJ family cysteine cluster protein [candidate division KSB1 bacterium]|nr:YkgJ family cysteine cluster protein [candidate division KSB1 bacterium]